MNAVLKVFLFFVAGLLFNYAPLSGAVSRADDLRSNPGAYLAAIYRSHISAVDGHECPSIPSCSSYSIAAFKKHGFFIGWMMTVDRLIHEGKEEARVSPVVYSDGKWKIFDPVENNDFWWFHKDRKRHE